jgi:sulfopropanediol 3-dehydrogenase
MVTPAVVDLKRPAVGSDPARDRAIVQRVTEMLLDIERGGMDAIRRWSRELDAWEPASFRVSDAEIARATAALDGELLEHIAFAQAQIRGFAERQRAALVDFEHRPLPGIVLGQRQVPVEHVGAYVPGGRAPLLASAFMTILVPKVAGVDRVIACAPPRGGEGIYPAMLHAMATSGADEIFAIGGVQALAAMAFGIEDAPPVDMLVGAGNAFVAEAKRQLFGRVGIDLLAGPTEIVVIADGTADAELVAADLLGQAEHGPTSAAVLITTSEELGRAVLDEIPRQLETLPTAEVAGMAWNDQGRVALVVDREAAVALSDELAPEHLEIQTAHDDWYAGRLRNYGTLFVGERSTVAYSDKAIGTNHVLPTARAARYTGGLSVGSFLKTLTFQRVESDEGTLAVGPPTAGICAAELMWAHRESVVRRLRRLEG